MKIKSIIYEKGRVYIPVELRRNFGVEGKFFKTCKSISRKAGYDYYFKWLTEKTVARISEDVLRRYKKRGWKGLIILGKVGTKDYVKGRWNFLIVYSPFIHMEISLASLIESKEGLPLVEMKDAIITYFDKAGKITIPTSYRKYAYVDYPPESKIKYVKISMVKKEFVLELWNPGMWKTAPRIIKQMFEDYYLKERII